MATEILLKSRASITCQTRNGSDPFKANEYPSDTTWNTSGNYYGGTPLAIDNTYDGGSENGKGAEYVNLILLVTTGPATAATAQVWYSESEDNTNYTVYKYSHTIGDTIAITTAGDGKYYDAGMFVLKAQYTKLALAAISYDIPNMTLYAYPKVVEAQ